MSESIKGSFETYMTGWSDSSRGYADFAQARASIVSNVIAWRGLEETSGNLYRYGQVFDALFESGEIVTGESYGSVWADYRG